MSNAAPQQADSKAAETQLDRFARRIHSLYSLPAVALEVVQLTRSPSVDATTLTQCLQRDPALVAKVLKAVNSSLYGLAQPVGNLQQGLALLGSRPLQLLVLGFSLPPELVQVSEAKALTRFWHMALVRAVAAKEIARRWYRLPSDEPFLAGLLQDLGMLALLKELGPTYARFLESADEEELDLEEVELAALGFDHRCLTARLLAKWGLPEAIVTAIGAGRGLEANENSKISLAPLSQIAHLADLLAKLLVTQHNGILTELLNACKAYLNLTLADVQMLVDGLQETVHEIAKALSLDLPQQSSYVEIIREAHERMARLTSGEEDVPTAPNEAKLLAGITELSLAARGSLKATGQSTNTVHPAELTSSRPAPTLKKKAESALTSLGLLPAITKSAMRCRQRRQPLSVVILRVNRADELLLLAGAHAAEQIGAALAEAIREKHKEAAHQEAMHVLRQGENGLACVFENIDRHQAVEIARQAMVALEWWVEQECESLVGRLSISAGAATASQLAKNFPAEQLIAAAERCLTAATMLECNSVKSIDVL
jgi:HD-like signal output (HDOD) protein